MDSQANQLLRPVRPGESVDWRRRYATRLTCTDFLVLIWVVFGVQIAWLGFDETTTGLGGSRDNIAVSYTVISTVIVLSWVSILGTYGSRSPRVVGAGSEEYKIVADATLRLFGGIAIVAFLIRMDIARGYILIALPLGLAVLVFTRWLWRQWLAVERQHGDYSDRVVLVGSLASVSAVAQELAKNTSAGYRVVAACVPRAEQFAVLPGTAVPLSNQLGEVSDLMRETSANTLIVTSSDELPPQKIRELSWTLVAGKQHLVVAPSLTDIGGPRIHMRPVAGLPLVHVETPRYDGMKAFNKRAFDIAVSALLIVLLSPVLLVVAAAVKATSPGPVLYRSERIGHGGRPFPMLKFRSMTSGADKQLAELLELQGTADKPLFKIRHDPRITPLGRILRKWSLDELPQLINVFLGTMSLVGPRPQIAAEVALYDDAARRRLLLKPGVSGLWQVSGRSTLTWEDAIRLDLYYVENWSLIGDLVILWRTVRAVAAPGNDAF